jgi:two-component system phosphate regulon sensor histidine kinase PhoR
MGIVSTACALAHTNNLIVIVWAAVLAAAVLLWVIFHRFSLSIARLRGRAARMLEADLPTTLDAPDAARVDDDVDLTPELRPLGADLDGVAERMRTQLKEVAKKSRNLEALIDAMDEPLLATDDQDRVILASRSAEAIVDAPPGGLVGRPIHEVFTTAAILEMHAKAKAGAVHRGRVRVVTPMGTRAFQVSASPVPAAWGAGVFGAVLTLRDVTELDQAVQVKTDFVANASHELRTPVAAIRSAAETMAAAEDDPAMTARLRGMIVSHADRLEEMLRDLLDLSRLESPDVPLTIEPVDLGQLERSLRTLSEIAVDERHLGLSFEFDDELRGLRTDRKLLTLILRNLVENATKFAHEGTTVRIVGQLIEEREPDPTGAIQRGVVRFEVIDKGVGIPLAQQERVFERYYQVDQARTGTGSNPTGAWRRGTGLGLAIVKHAAKALGGRTGLTSVWGQGTTVFVEFPCELGKDLQTTSSSIAASNPAPPRHV